jgi:hypothetical protein
MIFANNFLGRLGNKMLQYASLYALSKKTDLCLNIPNIEEFNTHQYSIGNIIIDTESVFKLPTIGGHYIKYAEFDFTNIQNKIVNTSHLENIYNFREYKQDIQNIFKLNHYNLNEYSFFINTKAGYEKIQVENITCNDIVLNIRLGDFIYPPYKFNPPHRLLKYEYFKIILQNIKYDRLFITSDEPFHPFINEFRHLSPIIVQNDTPIKTMSFIKKFNKIAISQSTFSWWGAYLSNAKEIYYPIPRSGPWSIKTEFSVSGLYLREHSNSFFYVDEKSKNIYDWKDAPGRRDYDDF